ncbi:hypothetical protein Fcan01_27786 [Folsomia candida]|uniref:Uncharacterized protein n=1 Tax=Folsomia candida TaxID=158441 RepID=A0A226CXE5_FOLCA|nr:hypothetical protein Fcan01_27786 [Folsomia candida]
MVDDFNIKFINNEGYFIAHLAIQIPTFNAAGEYMTNLTLLPKHSRTPEMYFLGNSSYNSSISFLEFGLEVEGRASGFENIIIRSVNLSFAYENFDTQFSNLTLRSASRPPGGSEVRGHQDGRENISTEFLDENGTFVADYYVEFPVIYLSGNYESDLTLYARANSQIDRGEWSLIGAGQYNWTVKSVWINVRVFGRAPMTEKMSVSNVDFSLGIERLQEREGLKFTALHNFIITFGGNLTTDKHPTYWREVINHCDIEDFIFHDKDNELNVAFPEVVGKQLLWTTQLVDYVITVRQPTTWSTAMTSEPETEFTEDETPTITTHLATSTTVASTTSTTEAPDIPDNVDLLLNQTQILLDQAQFLIKIVQARI